MTGLDRCGVLLAAHGERGGHADNASVERLATALTRRGLAGEVGFGFIKGTPTIPEAIKSFTALRIIVYPLFFSDGYFTTIRLPQLLNDAGLPVANRTITVLPPLGTDRGLAPLLFAKAARAKRENRYAEHGTTVVLLGHGSTKDPASRRATERLAEQVRALEEFSAVSSAFLEEAPTLDDVIQRLPGAAVVVGLFAGEGLHGGEDMARLIAGFRRRDVAFAGNVGAWPEIEDVVAAAISRSERSIFREAPVAI